MSDSRYHLVLRGTLQDGQARATAVAALAQLFKADAATVERLLSGKPSIIKRDLDAARAKQWLAAIGQTGAEASVIKATPAAASSDNAAVSDENESAADEETQTAAGEAASARSSDDAGAAFSLRPQAGDILDASEKPCAIAASVAAPEWNLAPAGSDLLSDDERAPTPEPRVAPALEMAELGARLAEAAEPIATPAPNTAHLQLQQI